MIRRIERDEIPECVRVIRTSFATVADMLGFTEKDAPRFTAFATTEQRLQWQWENEDRIMFACVEDGKILGYCSVLFLNGKECEMNNLCILPEYRHEKKGEELLLNAFEIARERGCQLMKIGIVEENTVLRQWYERYGFIHTGSVKYDFFPFTCGNMEIRLEKPDVTTIYFVRHAQPVFNADDRNRPLSDDGMKDTEFVADTLKDKPINAFFCSPYRRSMDTIRKAAEDHGMEIHTDERFRERKNGKAGNRFENGLLKKRWEDHTFAEEDGECLQSVQERNIEALSELLKNYEGKTLVIGTHGTALSTIINHYRPEFGYEDFLRIVDRMPWIVKAEFKGQQLWNLQEIAWIHKDFATGKTDEIHPENETGEQK